MPQGVNKQIRRQVAESKDAFPAVLEPLMIRRCGRRHEHDITRPSNATKHVTCGLRERAHAASGLGVAKDYRASWQVDLIPA
jgi:hypothetical protein